MGRRGSGWSNEPAPQLHSSTAPQLRNKLVYTAIRRRGWRYSRQTELEIGETGDNSAIHLHAMYNQRYPHTAMVNCMNYICQSLCRHVKTMQTSLLTSACAYDSEVNGDHPTCLSSCCSQPYYVVVSLIMW